MNLGTAWAGILTRSNTTAPRSSTCNLDSLDGTCADPLEHRYRSGPPARPAGRQRRAEGANPGQVHDSMVSAFDGVPGAWFIRFPLWEGWERLASPPSQEQFDSARRPHIVGRARQSGIEQLEGISAGAMVLRQPIGVALLVGKRWRSARRWHTTPERSATTRADAEHPLRSASRRQSRNFQVEQATIITTSLLEHRPEDHLEVQHSGWQKAQSWWPLTSHSHQRTTGMAAS